ncbi:unnamed protein product, partial [Mesorhabditis spiculigera]
MFPQIFFAVLPIFCCITDATPIIAWSRIELKPTLEILRNDFPNSESQDWIPTPTLKGCLRQCYGEPECKSIIWCCGIGCRKSASLLSELRKISIVAPVGVESCLGFEKIAVGGNGGKSITEGNTAPMITTTTSMPTIPLPLTPTWSYNKTNYYLIVANCTMGAACIKHCNVRNLELPTIHSSLENAALLRHMRTRSKCVDGQLVHIGMSWRFNAANKHQSIWRDRSKIVHTNWKTSEPSFTHAKNGINYNETCTLMQHSGEWNDGNTTWNRVDVKNLDVVVILPDAGDRLWAQGATFKACLKGCIFNVTCKSFIWCLVEGCLQMGGSLSSMDAITACVGYEIAAGSDRDTSEVDELPTTKTWAWVECVLLCNSLNLQLPTVHSTQENAALLSKMLKLGECVDGRVVHLGMGWRYAKDGSYQNFWRDGSTIDFTNWNDNEPSYIHIKNNVTYTEPCTLMQSDGGWNDVSCVLLLMINRAPCVCMQRC